MDKCIVCKKYAPRLNHHYFVVPGHIALPNYYNLCDDHRGRRYSFEDFYNDDGTRKPFDPGVNIKE